MEKDKIAKLIDPDEVYHKRSGFLNKALDIVFVTILALGLGIIILELIV